MVFTPGSPSPLRARKPPSMATWLRSLMYVKSRPGQLAREEPALAVVPVAELDDVLVIELIPRPCLRPRREVSQLTPSKRSHCSLWTPTIGRRLLAGSGPMAPQAQGPLITVSPTLGKLGATVPNGSRRTVAKVGYCRLSPQADRRSVRPPLMMWFHRSTTGRLSHPSPFGSFLGAESRSATHRCGVLPWSARIYRQRDSTRRSPGDPHGCSILHPEFTVSPETGLTVNLSRELYATFLPSDLPSD